MEDKLELEKRVPKSHVAASDRNATVGAQVQKNAAERRAANAKEKPVNPSGNDLPALKNRPKTRE